ncbi:MAG: ABC transporter permease [Campylobacterales bacterium]|nr:ABC transporter permease [Campylobacterales bacterium]
MNKKLIRFVVSKYLRYDPTQPFISVTAVLAFVGVGLGVFVLIVAMAIMNGFDKEFEKKLFTMNYPITIYSKHGYEISKDFADELAKSYPDYKFSPFIRASAIAKKNDNMEGVVVFGIDANAEKSINSVVADALGQGGIGNFEALIGKKLKEDFDLGKNDKITIIFADGEPQGIGITPIMKRFSVDKNFSSGLLAYDKGYVYVNAKDLAKVLGRSEELYDGIHVYTKEPLKDIKTLRSKLSDDFALVGWWQQNGNFFAALALEKRALFVVLMLIILVASLNIVSSLLMTVMSRRKEIALLLSLGADKSEIKAIFFRLGAIIGGSGIVVGVALAMLALFLLSNFDIISLPADVYGSSKLPLDLSLIDFVLITLGSMVVVFLSSYYPAKKASEVDALTVLRSE